MKVRYERAAGPASTSMPPPWPARSPPRTGRRRRWRRWPGRWRRGKKRDRRATWLRWRVPSCRTVDDGAGAGVVAGTAGDQSAHRPV